MLNVAIIGAGPAGLTLALALAARREFNVTVFERGDDHRAAPTYNADRSYTIDITGHGLNAIDYVGARARFDSTLIPFKGVQLPFAGRVVAHSEPAYTGARDMRPFFRR